MLVPNTTRKASNPWKLAPLRITRKLIPSQGGSNSNHSQGVNPKSLHNTPDMYKHHAGQAVISVVAHLNSLILSWHPVHHKVARSYSNLHIPIPNAWPISSRPAAGSGWTKPNMHDQRVSEQYTVGAKYICAYFPRYISSMHKPIYI